MYSVALHMNICTVPCENVCSCLCGQRRPRLSCSSAQSDLSIYRPLTKSFAITKYIKYRAKVLMKLFACAGWSLYPHFTQNWRYLFAWLGQLDIRPGKLTENLKGCHWKQRIYEKTEIGDPELINLFICNYVFCDTNLLSFLHHASL